MAKRPASIAAGAGITLLVAAGCGPASTPATAPSLALEHDFGAIPHGEARQHDFSLALPGDGVGLRPQGFRSGCSCGAGRFVLRRGGRDHDLDGMTLRSRLLQPGDELRLRLTVDTAREEAVDRPTVTVHGTALFEDETSAPALQLPVVFQYSIDVPIGVRPSPHIAFGELARSQQYSQTLELHPDPGVEVRLGPVACADPRIEATLDREDGVQLLHVRFTPDPDGEPQPVQSVVEVGTDLANGYRLPILVSGAIISDIQVEPFGHMSFGRFDFSQKAEHFVNLLDHDRRRPAEFEILEVVDGNGKPWDPRDLEAEVQTIPGQERCSRVVLRYQGTLDPTTTRSFRGTIRLSKAGGTAPHVDITFVGFHNGP